MPTKVASRFTAIIPGKLFIPLRFLLNRSPRYVTGTISFGTRLVYMYTIRRRVMVGGYVTSGNYAYRIFRYYLSVCLGFTHIWIPFGMRYTIIR